MKLIIAGSRTISGGTQLVDVVMRQFAELLPAAQMLPQYKGGVSEVISGGANGVDQIGEQWASLAAWNMSGRQKPALKIFPANWALYGKRAGHIRNKQMAEYADALLLIWDGQSMGSADMKCEMQKLGKPIYEVIFQVSNTKKE